MLTAIAAPRPPRLDVKLLLLVAMLIASGLTFFAVCTDAHAATPAFRVAGLQIVEQDAPPTAVSHAVLWNDGTSLKWHTPDGKDETIAGATVGAVVSGNPEVLINSMLQLAGELEIHGHEVATKDDLAALVYLDGCAAIFGAAVGVVGCAWAMRRYAVVGLRARRWVSRAHRSLEQHQAQAMRSTYR